MIWIFGTGVRQLQYEIRLNPYGAGFELVTTYPDGYQRVETASDRGDLLRRSVDILKRLRDEGWVSGGDDLPELR